MQRGQQAPAVGQDPVGAAEQVNDVVVLAGEGDAGAVGFQLDGGQECLLGVFFPLGDVLHDHRGGGVPGIALQDMHGQPELGEPGQLGVPEPVGVAETDGPALAVSDLNDLAELAQPERVGARRVGLGASPVSGELKEQVPGLDAGEPVPDPLLLFLDDRHDLGVDQDGVGRDVDFGLGVAEPGDLLTLGSLGGPASGR